MPDILLEIVENKRSEIARRKALLSQDALASGLPAGNASFHLALDSLGLKLITELKPASPSAGVLRSEVNLDEVLASYNRYASAISVLTDKRYFNGSLELLSKVANNSPHPVLCKDFVLEPYQILEARKYGAQAVLLIVKILADEELQELHQLIVKLGMTPVVEVQTEEELSRALKLSPQVLLINNRNLNTFEIDLDTTRRLAPLIPPPAIAVSASGIQNRQDIEKLLPYCNRFLIGSALMQSKNLDSTLKELCRQ
jgi:indole-3-glycerol phosphate synthase